jgi:hypothetical protein
LEVTLVPALLAQLVSGSPELMLGGLVLLLNTFFKTVILMIVEELSGWACPSSTEAYVIAKYQYQVMYFFSDVLIDICTDKDRHERGARK